jgi:hypothetical protein
VAVAVEVAALIVVFGFVVGGIFTGRGADDDDDDAAAAADADAAFLLRGSAVALVAAAAVAVAVEVAALIVVFGFVVGGIFTGRGALLSLADGMYKRTRR